MIVDSLEYWQWIAAQRTADIEAEENIGTPDEFHYRLLKMELTEAQNKIEELNGD